MLKTVKSFISHHKLWDKSDQIGLAISGGKDSVCMAHVLNEMQVPFVMVHINYNLRGTNSDADAIFVRNLAAHLEYCKAVFVKSVDTASYAKEHKLNTQLAAREIRYDYFDELHKEGIFTKLITAHHQSDQLETFFINLNRQSGINGLKSIPIKRDYIIRPLLSVRSNEVVDYIKENKIAYREDSSNASDKYDRNKWRNVLLPSISNEYPDFEQNAVASIDILQQENELFSWLIEEKTKEITHVTRDSLSIDCEKLATYPQRGVVLYRILDKYGFSHSQCEQVLGDSTSTGAIFYSDTHQLLVDRNHYIVQKTCEASSATVEVDKPGTFSIDNHTLHIEETSEVLFTNDSTEETVSIAPKLFPLTLRYWQEGDRIQPLGMKGSKLLSDFFIDEKVNNIQKHEIPLLCKCDEVLWVVGFRISEKIKTVDKTLMYQLTCS